MFVPSRSLTVADSTRIAQREAGVTESTNEEDLQVSWVKCVPIEFWP